MMMNLNLFMFFLMMIFGLLVFISKRKHLLMTLISLEFIILVIYGLIFYFLNLMNYEFFYSMVFLTFSVCEGSLGLAIMVSLIRTHGNDYFQSYNILQC